MERYPGAKYRLMYSHIRRKIFSDLSFTDVATRSRHENENRRYQLFISSIFVNCGYLNMHGTGAHSLPNKRELTTLPATDQGGDFLEK